ncbi:MAG: 4Fe-4S dicluster domain-containing protein [Chitinophagaceae bacterium]
MEFIPQIIFTFLLANGIYFFYKKINKIKSNIKMGRNDITPPHWKDGILRVISLALGHRILFRNPLVGSLHFIIFSGFIIINIEIIEIILDGLLGQHRVLQPYFGSAYKYFINSFEVLAAGVVIVCIIFLFRRNIQKINRFRKSELKGWPSKDANLILIIEIILMLLFLKMNATDQILQNRGIAPYSNHPTGNLIISSLLSQLIDSFSNNTLLITERTCWWLHITGIIAFLNYLPYSKHLHILLAFPNSYYSNLNVKGKIKNMPVVQNEVLLAFNPDHANQSSLHHESEKFGAKDVMDLSRKNLLDAYSCTECGRCTASCPANLTGKLLSPRKIMMDTRDRSELLGKYIQKNGSTINDGKSLLYDYIKPEELMACTTCNACVEECPVSINPMDIIIQLRRYLIMEESKAPAEWVSMYSNIETNFAPWKFSPDERIKWIKS